MITFTVPGDPMGKARPRFSRKTRHAYTPTKTVNRETVIKLYARQAMAGRPAMRGAVKVSILATFPIPPSWPLRKRTEAAAGLLRPTVKPDWDNIGKLTDALNGVCWLDDKQVVDGRVVKVYGAQPSTRFEIEEA